MRATILIGFLALVAACDEKTRPTTNGAPSGPNATNASNASSATKPTGATGAGGPTWRRDVLPHLQKNCAVANGCHGENPTESIDLDLRPDAAYRSLVGHASSVRPSALLVAPGDASKSFVVDKLTGKLGNKEGKPMPLDAETGAPKEPTPDDRAFVDATLVPWINAGAREN